MPISEQRKALYPDDWPYIRARIMQRSGVACELCDAINGELVCRARDGSAMWWYKHQLPNPESVRRAVRIVLTVHHINHDPTDNRDTNLIALCQRCHLRLDAPWRGKRAIAKEAYHANRDSGKVGL